jgi:hypothetical protein
MASTLLPSRIEINTKIGMSKQHRLKEKVDISMGLPIYILIQEFRLPQYISSVFKKTVRNNTYLYYGRTMQIKMLSAYILCKTWSCNSYMKYMWCVQCN